MDEDDRQMIDRALQDTHTPSTSSDANTPSTSSATTTPSETSICTNPRSDLTDSFEQYDKSFLDSVLPLP